MAGLKRRGSCTPRPDRSAEFASYTPRPRAVAVAVAGPALASVPIPKLPKAKPGKRKPTVAERDWMDAITTLGCIALNCADSPGRRGCHSLIGASGLFTREQRRYLEQTYAEQTRKLKA